MPNVARFREQADGLCELLRHRTPRTTSSSGDLDFLLALGQLFALVVYGQLILEQAELTGLDADLLDEIFDVLVRDFSALRHRAARQGRRHRRSRQPGRWPTYVARSPTRPAPAGSGTGWRRSPARYEMTP